MFWIELLRYLLWVLLLGGFLAIASYVWNWIDTIYTNTVIDNYVSKQNYIFIRIFPPASNTTSIAEMESFLIGLNATYAPKDPIDYYVTGNWHDSFTFEIHAKNGRIGIFAQINETKLSLFRSALEARFPSARVVKASDPLAGFPDFWDTEKGFGEYKTIMGSEIDTTGGEKLLNPAGEAFEGNDVFPIKSWRDFQREDNTPIADPIVQLFSTMRSNSFNNYIILQFATVPFSQDNLEEKVKDRWKKEFSLLKQKFAEDSRSLGVEVNPENQQSMPLLSKQERDVLDAIGRKITEQIFRVKIRLTIFNKEGNVGDVFQEMMGYFEQYSTDVIKFAPRKLARTWDKDKGTNYGVLGPWLAQITNQVYWKTQSDFQTQAYYRGFKGRRMSQVAGSKYYSVENLAGLFHFPVTTGEDPAKDQLAEMLSMGYGDAEDITIGSQAPANLPG